MKTHQIPALLLFLAVLLALVACAGGGSGGTGNTGGGVGGSGIIGRGAISELGSIVVNGTEYDTAGALVVIDGKEQGTGDAVVQEYLDEGKVVTVYGTEGDSEDVVVADRIFYNSAVKGPVSSKTDMGAGVYELTVMGQTVIVNHLTHLKNFTIEDISKNDVVEVSGFYDDEGTIWATFLEETGSFDPDVIYEITGFVNSLDAIQKTFVINGLQIDFANADLGGLPDAALENGLLVEAAGIVDDVFTAMEAYRISLEDELDAEDAGDVEIAGFVTEVSADEFMVGNQKVMIEEGAVFVDFACEPEQCGLDDIVPGMKLEAEGELVDGILLAWKIEFWEPDQFEIEGRVSSIEYIDISGSMFTVDDDLVVVTTAETVYEDGEFDNIQFNVNVEIKGRRDGDIIAADKVSFELGDI
jgi:hypothetical protein